MDHPLAASSDGISPTLSADLKFTPSMKRTLSFKKNPPLNSDISQSPLTRIFPLIVLILSLTTNKRSSLSCFPCKYNIFYLESWEERNHVPYHPWYEAYSYWLACRCASKFWTKGTDSSSGPCLSQRICIYSGYHKTLIPTSRHCLSLDCQQIWGNLPSSHVKLCSSHRFKLFYDWTQSYGRENTACTEL